MAYRRAAWSNWCSQENSSAASAMANRNTIKVHYSQQFARDFQQSATSAHVATDSDFRTKLQVFTCEWLCRPSVSVAETAATISQNIEKPRIFSTYIWPRNTLPPLERRRKKYKVVSVTNCCFQLWHLML